MPIPFQIEDKTNLFSTVNNFNY